MMGMVYPKTLVKQWNYFKMQQIKEMLMLNVI